MSKPITVRDRAGNLTIRHDGILLDGDHVHTTLGLLDGAAPVLKLTDAQRAIAARGIDAALQDHATRTAGVCDGAARVRDALAERDRVLCDGWKTPNH